MSRLLKATFDCEVVTPMFLAGANKNQPEIRAASIRGQLRWWFRAIYGGINGGDKKDCLEKEAALFGGTTGEKAGQSKIWIKIKHSEDQSNTIKASPLPHKNKNFTLTAIQPGTLFQVIITSHLNHEVEFECAKKLFRITSLLGGLGRRTRRGFGSYQSIDEIFSNKDDSVNAIKEYLQEAKESVQKVTKTEASIVYPKEVSPWPLISDKHFKLRAAKEETWDKFIKKLMNKISDGLSSETTDLELKPKVLGGINNGRQGSTMLVSVIKLKNEQIVPVFSQFFCNTNLNPKKPDFNNLDSFPERNFSATEITN